MPYISRPATPLARLSALLIAALLGVGCSDFSTEPTRTPAELRLTAENTFLNTGDTLRYHLELVDEYGEVYSTIPSWSPPHWSGERPERVDVSGGVVRPVRGGENRLEVELAGLTASVVVRANPTEMKVSVPLLYVTQSVQRTGGDVVLIAGREGLLRVVVRSDEENYHRPRVRATFHNGGSVVHTALLEMEGEGLPTRLYEGNQNLSYDGLIPGEVLQPGVGLSIEIDPDGAVPAVAANSLRIPAEGTLELAIREVTPFRLMMVPVDQAANGRTSRLNAETAVEMTVLTRDIFPLGDVELVVRESYVTEAALDTEQGWYDLIEEIWMLRVDDGNPHYYYGGFNRPTGTRIAGLGYVGYPVSIGMDNQPDVIAHEVGHNLNLPHAPCGGPTGVDPAYPYPSGRVGAFGYDRSTGYLQPNSRYDLMSYCDPIWISDYNYEKVLAYRETSPYDAPIEGVAGLRSGGDGAAPDGPTLVVRGGVLNGRLTLAPALEWDGPPSRPSPAGRYTLEGLDGSGATLFSMPVAPQQLDHRDDSHFLVAIPAVRAQLDRLAGLRLSGPEGVVVRTRSAGPAARRPDVKLRPRGARGMAARDAAVWDAGEYPLAVVRDRETGRIRAMSRSGRVTFPGDTDPSGLEVLLSDGLRTHRANVVRP